MTTNMFKQTIAEYGDFAGTPAILKGVSNVSFDGGSEFEEFKGDQDAHNMALISAAPSASFSTSDLKGILDITSLNIDELDATHKLLLNWRKMVHGGSFAGGSNDVTVLFNKGVMFPTSLSCSQGQICSLGVSVLGAWDGTNDPVTLDKAATCSSEVVQDRSYTMYAFKFGASGALTIPQESVTFDFGFDVVSKSSDGETFPSLIVQNSRAPSIKVSSFDLSKAVDFDYKGTQDETDDLIFYFARLKEGGSRYPNNETEHIKITIKKHHISAGQISESAEVTLRPLWDGTNDIFTFDTASIIS